MAKKTNLIVTALIFFYLGGQFTVWGASITGAENLILQDRYAQAAKECKKLIAQRNPVSTKARAEYLWGICLLKQAKYSQAREKFSQLLRRYPSSAVSDDASLAMAHSYFLAGDYSQASSKYQRFLRDHAHSELDTIARAQLKLCRNGSSLGNSYFTVQVGCFAGKKNAQGLRDELIDRGYQAYILELEGEGLFRVRVGKYETRSKAEFLENRLKAKGYPTKVCP